jgi:hypothetical protein
MRKMNKAWILMAALLLIAPTYVLAQTHASKEFPNDKDGSTNNVPLAGGGTINFDVIMSAPGGGFFPDIHTADRILAPGDDGDTVAYASLDTICAAAVGLASPFICSGLGTSWTNPDPMFIAGSCGPTYGQPAADCCSRDAAGTYVLTCEHPAKALKGFTLTKKAVGIDVDAKGGGTKLNSVKHTTKAGNNVTEDLLPHFIVRVNRPSPVVNGTITFTVVSQGSGTESFPINSTSFPTDIALHDAIAAGYGSLGVALNCLVKKFSTNETPTGYNGPFVYCANLQGKQVSLMAVGGLPGQEIHVETTSGIGYGNIPTLSEWGLILLVVILSLSALWMLRRRRQIGSVS